MKGNVNMARPYYVFEDDFVLTPQNPKIGDLVLVATQGIVIDGDMTSNRTLVKCSEWHAFLVKEVYQDDDGTLHALGKMGALETEIELDYSADKEYESRIYIDNS